MREVDLAFAEQLIAAPTWRAKARVFLRWTAGHWPGLLVAGVFSTAGLLLLWLVFGADRLQWQAALLWLLLVWTVAAIVDRTAWGVRTLARWL
jgi:hypothetical protein